MIDVVQLAIDMFKVPITVTDYVYSTSNGEDIKTLSATRSIEAAVDPSRSKEMERIFGGSMAAGDIGVYTTETLYIDDEYQAGAIRKQSFVTYQSIVYRVSDSQNWQPQAGLYVYLCKRYKAQ